MPRGNKASLSVALSPNAGIADRVRSPGAGSNHAPATNDYQTSNEAEFEGDALPSPPLSLPQSPASPRSQHRSFFSGYRASRLGKPRGEEYPSGRIPSGASTSTLLIPGSHLPPRPTSPSPSDLSTSPNNQFESLGISDRGALDGTAPGEPEVYDEKTDLDNSGTRRPSKTVFHFMSRSRSTRTPDVRPSTRSGTARRPEPVVVEEEYQDSAYTAPLEADRGYRDAMKSMSRNKSADRTASATKDGGDGQFKPSSTEGPGLFSNIKSTSTKAADGLGRAGKGLFRGLQARTGSGQDRDSVDENYIFRVINLPLVEQTRRTRIRKRLEEARDKTEYWLPALPYRCIDYLNMKGVEEEGLYRIPGSGREVKQWQTRFDTELDINLLDEHELYDINIIGSMLKSWLRELPDELFPKSIQSKIAMECAGATETPQIMKDELSKLPPFHYYLLFAITCHIAILHSHAEKNKMGYQNLCICFQPCMGIDGFCFYFLVCDWRNCWQGCWTENAYYVLENNLRPPTEPNPPMSSAGHSVGASSSHASEDRPFSATTGSRPQTGGAKSSSASSEKRRRSPIAQDESRAWEAGEIPQSPRSKLAAGTTTPPSLSPLASVSPMRL